MDTPNANQDCPKKEFTINTNENKSFILTLQNKKSSLYINISTQTDILKLEYDKNFSLNDLKENKYLSILDSIDEIYEEIINFINTKLKDVKIIEEKNKIILTIPTGGLKVKEISLILNEKELDEKQQINELFNIISNLKKENNELKINQKKLEERIQYLESFINDINSWYDKKQKEKKRKNKLFK